MIYERKLSPIESVILGLICEGLTNAEIADVLQIKPSTVANTMSSIYLKLQAKNRAHAATIAKEKHLVDKWLKVVL